jgi:hypothetical protein
MFTFDVRTTGVQEAINRLNRIKRDMGDKVVVAALNDTIQQTRTQMIRNITAEYAVTATLVRDRLSIQRAKRQGANAFVATLIGNPAGRAKRAMNLIHFLRAGASLKATRKASNKLHAELRFRIRRAGGDLPIKGAFVGNKGRTIFQRVGKDRLPIKAVQTIGVPQMFQAKKVQIPVQRWIDANFPRIFDQRLRYYLGTVK